MPIIIWSGLLNSLQPHEFPTPEADDIASGAHSLIGYDIDLTPPDGSARITLTVEDRHLNRIETLHGGIIAMMLDAAAGFAASRGVAGEPFQPVMTLSLSTSYVRAAKRGMVVTAIGQRRGGGRSIQYADAVLQDSTGEVLASASGVFKRSK